MVQFQEMLKEHGMKTTAQRVFILQSLSNRGHATIEEIHRDLIETNPAMSVTTVYRNINEMMKNSLIDEIKISKHKDRYEISKEPHLHLVCQNCGELEDLKVEIKPLVELVEKSSGCLVKSDSIVLDVICKECLTSIAN